MRREHRFRVLPRRVRRWSDYQIDCHHCSVVAVLAAALIALQIAITDDRITNAEWVAIAIAGLGALGVWAFPNRPPAGEPPRPDMSEQG